MPNNTNNTTKRKMPSGALNIGKAITVDPLLSIALGVSDTVQSGARILGTTLNVVENAVNTLDKSVDGWSKKVCEEIASREEVRNEPEEIAKRKAFYRADEKARLEELYGSLPTKELSLEEQIAELEKAKAERDAKTK